MKSEAELIAKVETMTYEECINLAENARKNNKAELEKACRQRAAELRPKKAAMTIRKTSGVDKKTNRIAIITLSLLAKDYLEQKPLSTDDTLAERCNERPGRWFGQVTDLIDAACALANVESFALIRVRTSNGQINPEAWNNQYQHLRGPIIEAAERANWSENDFKKITTNLEEFKSLGLGNKRAWQFVMDRIDLEEWARNPRMPLNAVRN